MKFLRLLAVVTLLLAVTGSVKAQNAIAFNTVAELRSFLHWKPSRFPLISAHRGGPMPGYPENCIETFENAIKYQPLIIEFDVALSQDSVLVVLHDDKLDRTTTGTGSVREKTYAQLQQLRLKDNDGKVTDFKMPTLEEVLKWAKGKVLLTIDVKRGVPFSRVVDAVRRNKADNYAIVITYNANQAAEVYRLAPELMLSVSANKPADIVRLNELGVPTDRLVAFVGITPPSAENYAYLHKLGITCILGTMGNLDRSAVAGIDKNLYAELIDGGADVLSTDNLVLAGKQLDKLRTLKQLKHKNIKKK